MLELVISSNKMLSIIPTNMFGVGEVGIYIYYPRALLTTHYFFGIINVLIGEDFSIIILRADSRVVNDTQLTLY